MLHVSENICLCKNQWIWWVVVVVLAKFWKSGATPLPDSIFHLNIWIGFLFGITVIRGGNSTLFVCISYYWNSDSVVPHVSKFREANLRTVVWSTFK